MVLRHSPNNYSNVFNHNVNFITIMVQQFFLCFALVINVSSSILIKENNFQRLSFTFTTDNYTSNVRPLGGQEVTYIDYSGATTEVLTKENFRIPCTAVSIGVPSTGEVSFEFVSLEVKQYKLEHPLPRLDEKKNIYESKKDMPIFTNPWISDIDYRFYRNLRVGRLFLKPFIYHAPSKTLTVLVKGVCTIYFPATSFRKANREDFQCDYYKSLEAVLLNYSVAQNWLSKRTLTTPLYYQSTIGLPHQPMLKFKIGDDHREFNESMTEENGIMKITGTDLNFLLSSPVSISGVTLYGSDKNELSLVTPTLDNIPSGVTKIPVLRFDLNNNGLFDKEDYLLAYVTGISDWNYDSIIKDYDFNLHDYDTSRHYWLGLVPDNQAMKSFSCVSAPMKNITTFVNRIRYKKSSFLHYDLGKGKEYYGGLDWAWRLLKKSEKKYSYILDIPDPVTSEPGFLKITGKTKFNGTCRLTIFLGSKQIPDLNKWVPFSNWSDSLIQFSLVNFRDSSYFQLEHIDAKYTRPLSLKGKKKLSVFSPLDSGLIVSYKLSDIPKERMIIIRIPENEENCMLIADTVCETGEISWIDTTGLGVRYFICTESNFLSPGHLTQHIPLENTEFEINNPRFGVAQTDYLIVTHPDLKSEAQRLAEHKKNSGKFKEPRIIEVATIMREFSGGNTDPGAIRNFLQCALNVSSSLKSLDYVLFFGNGNYDYKRYRAQEINYVPTAQWKALCLEDFFSCLNPGEDASRKNAFPDLFLGRIPCNSLSEGHNVVDKIIEMEGPEADYGVWRNRILLVSDDDMQGKNKDNITDHYLGNETIEADLLHNRPSMRVRKVYLFNYEFNDVYEKPEATEALFREVNNGVSCVNFFGHGSENTWADEYLLEKDKIGNFMNKARYPIFNSFSCSVGRFDDPGKTCISGMMVKAPRSGAIAAISSSRVAYNGVNQSMGKVFYNQLYKNGTSRSLGQVYQITKSLDNGNLKNYVFLGDPSIRFYPVTDTIKLALYDTQDKPILHDTLKALQAITIKGEILKNNMLNTSFGMNDSAFVHIGLFNPKQDSVERKDGINYTNPIYSMPGRPLFTGITKVKNGMFKQELRIPRRVVFNKPGATLTAYAWDIGKRDEPRIAMGVIKNLQFQGSVIDTNSNSEGPRIAVRPVYDVDSMWNAPVGFTDQISSFLPLTIEINVWDKDGLDNDGDGPDEGLTLEIPNIMKNKNINHKFIFNDGSYIQGYANETFAQNELKPGTYDLHIGAQDNFGNQTKLIVTLEILAPEDFSLGHVFNYPNPISMGGKTRFYFYHTNTSQKWHGGVQVSIKIFTLSGKLIRLINYARNGHEWDLNDQRGKQLPPNVYLYRIFAHMTRGDFSGNKKIIKSPIRKLVIYPPN